MLINKAVWITLSIFTSTVSVEEDILGRLSSACSCVSASLISYGLSPGPTDCGISFAVDGLDALLKRKAFSRVQRCTVPVAISASRSAKKFKNERGRRGR